MAQIYLGNDSKSLAVKIVSHFTNAAEGELVQLTDTTLEEQKFQNVITLPALVTSVDGKQEKSYSAYSIIEQISKLTNFEKKFVGGTEFENSQILSYFEIVPQIKDQALAELLNKDLKLRTYLVGHNITAADIFAYAYVVNYTKGLTKEQFLEYGNLFRWVDQIQHFPGINAFVVANNLLIDSIADPTPLPVTSKESTNEEDKTEETPKLSKKQLKKLAKKEAREQYKAEKAGKDGKPEEDKQAKQPKPQKQKAPAKKEGEVDYTAEPITLIDFRVGHIVKVWRHPDSDYLYCCHIDIGEEEPRTIATGLQKVVPIEVLEDAKVLVAANLKARNMGGFKSDGMVLCTENDDGTNFELLTPPDGAVPGEFVTFEGFDRNPPARLNKKKKIFETVQPDFKCDGEGIAHYKEAKWLIGDKGAVFAKTFRNGPIS